MSRRAVGVVCALLVAGLVPVAARADVEPNDVVFAPEGPIAGGQAYGGTLGPSDSEDWYVLYVEGVRQLHLIETHSAPHCATVRLTDGDGQPIASDYTSPPGTTRFFVQARRNDSGFCPGATYSFRVEPAVALVTGPGRLPVRGVAEPNDTRGDASGPLLPGTWYYGTLETVNDEDWLSFYVRPRTRRVDVEMVAPGSACLRDVSLRSASGRVLDSSTGGGSLAGTIAHLTHRVGGGARLFTRAVGSGADACIGSPVAIKAGPDDAVMSKTEVRTACAQGRRGNRRWARRVAADLRRIARSDGDVPRGLRRQLARDRRKLKQARRLISVYCEP